MEVKLAPVFCQASKNDTANVSSQFSCAQNSLSLLTTLERAQIWAFRAPLLKTPETVPSVVVSMPTRHLPSYVFAWQRGQ